MAGLFTRMQAGTAQRATRSSLPVRNLSLSNNPDRYLAHVARPRDLRPRMRTERGFSTGQDVSIVQIDMHHS